jgi:hypothetical protein
MIDEPGAVCNRRRARASPRKNARENILHESGSGIQLVLGKLEMAEITSRKTPSGR